MAQWAVRWTVLAYGPVAVVRTVDINHNGRPRLAEGDLIRFNSLRIDSRPLSSTFITASLSLSLDRSRPEKNGGGNPKEKP